MKTLRDIWNIIHDGARPYLKKENIDDILKHLGMGEYNQWEIYKKNMGVNVSDYACIRFYKNSDSNDFFYPI